METNLQLDVRKRVSRSVDLNRVPLAIVAGAMAGLFAGIPARVAMRAVAVYGGMQPSFSIGGTMGILIVGLIMGAPLGALYLAAEGFLPRRRWLRGALFGLLLFLLQIAILSLFMDFQEAAEGEIGSLGVLNAFLIFAPVPAFFGVSTELALGWLEADTSERTPRLVGAGWIVLLILAAGFTVSGLGSLMDMGVVIPRSFVMAYHRVGLNYNTSRLLHRALVGGFGVAYAGLALWMFWRGSQRFMPKFAALTLLALAAGFFHTHSFEPMVASQPAVMDYVYGSLRWIGFGSLLFLLYLYPDGRFAYRWMFPVAAAWLAWLFLWFIPVPGGAFAAVRAWPEPLLALVTLGGLATGIVALIQRHRTVADPSTRRPIRALLTAAAVAVGGLALLWTWALAGGEARAWTAAGFEGLFAFGPYLLPWLLLPLAISRAMRRDQLWGASTG